SAYNRLESQEELANARISYLEQSQKEMGFVFENTANRIASEQTIKFSQSSNEKIDQLLKPLQDRLLEFTSAVKSQHESEIDQHAKLGMQIEQMRKEAMQIGNDAVNLTKALKGDSKMQGNWGEMVLERCLEAAGLSNNQEFVLQNSFGREEGGVHRPDAVVYLPNNRQLVIDAKVSLVAYERYCTSLDSDDLRSHVASITTHVKQLSEKGYHKLAGINTVDLVIMFVPIEVALSVAFKHNPEIYEQALRKNIIIVTPSTLLATLRSVAHVWRQEKQDRNVAEVVKLAGDLYDKFVLFSETFIKNEDLLLKLQSSFNQTKQQLCEGKGNLVKRVEELKSLGIHPKKQQSGRLVELSEK
ncbi:MAG: DNA recombination protein RmuC, partial [Lentisphaeria bacterium]